MKSWKDILDEKVIGIVVIGAIAIVSLFKLAEPNEVVIPSVTAIAGLIVGRITASK